jgi:hypothetical protein
MTLVSSLKGGNRNGTVYLRWHSTAICAYCVCKYTCPVNTHVPLHTFFAIMIHLHSRRPAIHNPCFKNTIDACVNVPHWPLTRKKAEPVALSFPCRCIASPTWVVNTYSKREPSNDKDGRDFDEKLGYGLEHWSNDIRGWWGVWGGYHLWHENHRSNAAVR